MARRLTLAALVLALGLTAAGCGTTAGAGAAANRWAGSGAGNAVRYQNEARGPLSDGRYAADEDGRVSGFRKDGTEMLRGAKDAAKNVSDMAEEAIDGAVDSARR